MPLLQLSNKVKPGCHQVIVVLHLPTPLSHMSQRTIDFTDKEGILAKVEHLAKYCQPATFGRGSVDVHDESHRKAGKMDTNRFSTSFDLAQSEILEVVKTELNIEHDLYAELYKLNVYGQSMTLWIKVRSNIGVTSRKGWFLQDPKGHTSIEELLSLSSLAHTKADL